MPVNAMARLFGRSPFVPLQLHLDKVADCVEAVFALLERIREGDVSNVDETAREISSSAIIRYTTTVRQEESLFCQ